MNNRNGKSNSVSRSEFLKGGAALALTVPWIGVQAGQVDAAGDPAPVVQEVAPGVFVHHGVHEMASAANRGDICNTSFVIGASSVAVIDTGGCAKVGAGLRAAIAAKTSLPVSHVITTHMHPDHVLGNAAFLPDKPQFVGHHKLLRALAERSDSYLEAAKEQLGPDVFEGTQVVLPTLLVENETTLDIGGRTLSVVARPTAHTNNDLTVRDGATDTVFLGDLVFVERLPTVDGSLRGWLKMLDQLEKEPAARVVPGHGPVTMPWPGAATDIKRYLTVLATDVRAAISAGKTMSQAMETAAQSERGKWQLFDENNARNVSAAFAELEWE